MNELKQKEKESLELSVQVLQKAILLERSKKSDQVIMYGKYTDLFRSLKRECSELETIIRMHQDQDGVVDFEATENSFKHIEGLARKKLDREEYERTLKDIEHLRGRQQTFDVENHKKMEKIKELEMDDRLNRKLLLEQTAKIDAYTDRNEILMVENEEFQREYEVLQEKNRMQMEDLASIKDKVKECESEVASLHHEIQEKMQQMQELKTNWETNQESVEKFSEMIDVYEHKLWQAEKKNFSYSETVEIRKFSIRRFDSNTQSQMTGELKIQKNPSKGLLYIELLYPNSCNSYKIEEIVSIESDAITGQMMIDLSNNRKISFECGESESLKECLSELMV